MKMERLVVNGEAYQVHDPEAAHIDDAKVGKDSCWSSAQILQRLYPDFRETGAAVACMPVAGYPLDVVSQITPVQEGSGAPSPGGYVHYKTVSTTMEYGNGEASFGEGFDVGIYRVYDSANNKPPVVYNPGYNPEYTANGLYSEFEVIDTWVEVGFWIAPNEEAENDPVFVIERHTPGNIRPVKGHTGCKLWRGGKSVIDFVGLIGTDNCTNTVHGLTAELKDGMVHLYGTSTNTTYTNVFGSPRFAIGKYPVLPGTYSLGNKGNFNVQLHDVDTSKNINYTGTFTITKTLYLVYFFVCSNYAGETLDLTFPLMMVAGTEAPTEYEPYHGETFTIDFGQEAAGGKNLLPCPYLSGSGVTGGLTSAVGQDGSVVFSGTPTGNADYDFVKDLSLPAGTYTFSVSGSFSTKGVPFVFVRSVEKGALATITLTSKKSGTFTLTEDCDDITIYIYMDDTAYVTGTVYPQLEAGSAATAYVPYAGGSGSDRTVYGGSFHWGTGVLTVTHGCIASYSGGSVPEGWISSTGMLSQGAQVVYPLAEPFTIQLTPQEILALSGTNTLYSDTGVTQVTGKQDLVLMLENIQKRLAALGTAAVNEAEVAENV